jgi:hypothetical protein
VADIYIASTDEVEVSWRGTITGHIRHSRHAFLALMLNLVTIISFVHVEMNLGRGAIDATFRLTAALAFIALVAVINIYAWRLRQQTAAALEIVLDGSQQAVAILNTSYLGYRLYLLSLLVLIVCLGGMSMLRLS